MPRRPGAGLTALVAGDDNPAFCRARCAPGHLCSGASAMRHARAYAIVGLATLAAAAVAFAQSTTAPLEEATPVESAPLEAASVAEILEGTTWGDPENGAALAATCAACHGMDGKSTVRDIYPSMGGQSERYMAHQLALFKNGERVSPIMQPFAEMLSGQDMRDLGAYYASQ